MSEQEENEKDKNGSKEEKEQGDSKEKKKEKELIDPKEIKEEKALTLVKEAKGVKPLKQIRQRKKEEKQKQVDWKVTEEQKRLLGLMAERIKKARRKLVGNGYNRKEIQQMLSAKVFKIFKVPATKGMIELKVLQHLLKINPDKRKKIVYELLAQFDIFCAKINFGEPSSESEQQPKLKLEPTKQTVEHQEKIAIEEQIHSNQEQSNKIKS